MTRKMILSRMVPRGPLPDQRDYGDEARAEHEAVFPPESYGVSPPAVGAVPVVGDMFLTRHYDPATNECFDVVGPQTQRIDGVLQATEPVKDGDVLVVENGATAARPVTPPYFMAAGPVTPEDVEAWKSNLESGSIVYVPSEKKGEKFDSGKVRLGLNDDYFPRAQMALAAVSMYGLRKYATSNATGSGWQFVTDAMRRYGDDALRRHTLLQKMEGHYDAQDSGLAHKAQRAWNAMADLELALKQGEIDLSFGNDIEFVDGKPKPVLGTAKLVSLKANDDA